MNDKLIKLRRKLGLSQEEFGQLIGVSRQAVSKWELGQSQPDLESLKRIKEKFNVSYDSLMSDEKVLESSNHFIELQRRKRQFFVLGVVLLFVSLFILLFYVAIRLTNYYDVQMARYQIVIPDEISNFEFLDPIVTLFGSKPIDFFYYFLRYGIMSLTLLSFVLGCVFIHKSMKIEKPSN